MEAENFLPKVWLADLYFQLTQQAAHLSADRLVEATGSLYNFKVISKVLGTDLLGAYQMLTERLIKRLCDFEMLKIRHPNVLAIHASSRKTSNSLMLWEKVKSYLDESIKVTEISLRNGQLLDCRGCKYEGMYAFRRKRRLLLWRRHGGTGISGHH